MKYLGVRWRHQGRARKTGLDCLGLVVVALEDLGYDVKDNTTYRRRPNDRLLLSLVSQQLDEVPVEDIQSGDIILMHFKDRNKSPYHFAIYTENGGMVHGYAPAACSEFRRIKANGNRRNRCRIQVSGGHGCNHLSRGCRGGLGHGRHGGHRGSCWGRSWCRWRRSWCSKRGQLRGDGRRGLYRGNVH
jgi:cell wall-associated NlpC family hydrolase